MRNYICIFTLISLVACNNAPSNSFRLEGSIEGAKESENLILYYYVQKNNELYEIGDTTKIINGKFLFEGNIDELTAAQLRFGDPNVAYDTRLYLEPTTMKLRIDKSQPYAYELSGTKVEKENIELRKELEPYEKINCKNIKDIDEILKQIELHNNNTFVQDSLYNQLKQLLADKSNGIEMNKIRYNFILNHNTYRIAPDLLYLLTKMESIGIDTIQSIYNNLPEKSKACLMGKLACKQIEYQEKYLESKMNASVGNSAPDFISKDFSGETIRLSDFINKNFVLLDFWASWCPPCVKEIPNAKTLYKKYSEKGLVIISISLDTDSTKWMNAINKYQLKEWPQILNIVNKNNTVFNKDDISFMYNIESIPHYILIDKQGKIIANPKYDEDPLNKIDTILRSR